MAYFLLLYIVAVTVLAVSWGAKLLKTEACEAVEPVTVEAPAVVELVEEKTATTASWYDYQLNDIRWSEDHRTAASREFERGTLVEVTNVANGKTVEVLINDYGPEYAVHPDRELDLSSFAFLQIAELQEGLIEVEYRELGKGEYHPLVRR